MGIKDFLFGKNKSSSQQKPDRHMERQPVRQQNERAFTGTTFERYIVSFEQRKKTSYPSINGLYVAEILLLEYCDKGKYPLPKDEYPDFWFLEYGIKNVNYILRSLEQRGFIRLGRAAESLDGLTGVKLKEILSAHGLAISGKKADLIARVRDNVSESDLKRMGIDSKYNLTALGRQELSDNEYVPYMHRFKGKTVEGDQFGSEFNIWSINKLTKGTPRRPFRDILWGELNRQLNEQMALLSRTGNQSCYSAMRNIHLSMYEICFDEKRYRDAFTQIATVLWYDIVVIQPSEYLSQRDLYRKHQSSEFTLQDSFFIAPATVTYIKKLMPKLKWTDEDVAKELQSVCNLINPYRVFTGRDYIEIVMAALVDDNKRIKRICAAAQARIR